MNTGLRNNGYRNVGKDFEIKNHSILVKWVRKFRNSGEAGLARKCENNSYSLNFKLDVLKFFLTSGESYATVAEKFKIPDLSIIANWLSAFRKEGIDGLSRKKGRPSMSKKNEKGNELTELQKLKKENELLKVELEFIKKLQASGIKILERLKK